jgi:hypothetical protein
MRRCDACRARDASSTVIPWENAEVGILAAFVQTWIRVVSRPWRFFDCLAGPLGATSARPLRDFVNLGMGLGLVGVFSVLFLASELVQRFGSVILSRRDLFTLAWVAYVGAILFLNLVQWSSPYLLPAAVRDRARLTRVLSYIMGTAWALLLLPVVGTVLATLSQGVLVFLGFRRVFAVPTWRLLLFLGVACGIAGGVPVVAVMLVRAAW